MKFMWPRLAMMKAMLKPGGVLAICIDHRELFRLGQMLDELFGEANRLAIINWQKSYSPRNDKQHVSTATEYVLVYAKDAAKAKTGLMQRTEPMDARYTSRDGDPPWKADNLAGGKGPTNQPMVYGIQSPFTGEIHYPPERGCWRIPAARVKTILEGWGVEYERRELDDAEQRARSAGVPIDQIQAGVRSVLLTTDLAKAKTAAAERLEEGHWPEVFFGVSGTGRPQLKRYLHTVKQGVVPWTWWADDEYESPDVLGPVSWSHEQSGHSQTGVDELTAILGPEHGFKTVKPLKLFMKLVQIWCPPGGSVMDPFAGSGTAGHAVLALNHESATDRRFILIEQGRPERGDPYATALTAARLRAVITGRWSSGSATPLPGGFEFMRLGRKVDAAALLKMERDEMVDTVIESHFDATRRRGAQLTRCGDSFRYLVAHNTDGQGFFLVWDGPTKNTDITEGVYEQLVAEAVTAGLSSSIYHVYARLWIYQTDDVRFLQIPDRILADFGLDARSEPFADSDTDESGGTP